MSVNKQGKSSEETTKHQEVEEFVPLCDILNSSFVDLRVKRASPVLLHFLLWHVFSTTHGRSPTADDVALLTKARDAVYSQTKLPQGSISDARIQEFATNVACELAPVAAIVGGQLTGEVIKAISVRNNQSGPSVEIRLTIDPKPIL